ncbi:MAG: tryptophan synthase subunit beta [Bacteroidetes bacterium]|nr:tryptophan synthase subunit beta [Bacteroidota bacterium]
MQAQITKGYSISKNGYYGNFGGAYIPELLYNNVNELVQNYLQLTQDPDFNKELNLLLKDYVGRPSPLYFAKKLSKKYGAKIYLKREDLNHTGSHKINNALGQALLAKKLGKQKIIAETGAGQHGAAAATACALLGLECTVFMGEVDIERQAPNVSRMKMLGAKIIPATSGTRTLKDATNEAIRYWINNNDSYYLIGSVVGPHPYPDLVTRFQAIISKEIKEQLLTAEGKEDPDYVLACIGGGSNAAGAFYNFIGNERVKLIGIEAAGKGLNTEYTAATLQKGSCGIIHGSKTFLMQTYDGQITEPYSISAGLDYPGIGPLHAHLQETKLARYLSATDEESLAAAFELMQEEGIIPALESAHAFAVLKKIEFKENEVVVINLSGRGDKDLDTYLKHFN